jgi:hypothetical protein
VKHKQDRLPEEEGKLGDGTRGAQEGYLKLGSDSDVPSGSRGQMYTVHQVHTTNLRVIDTTKSKVLEDVGKCMNLCFATLTPKELNVR